MALLALDAGNTNLVAGLYWEAERRAEWRFPTPHNGATEILQEAFAPCFETYRAEIEAVAIASVVPSLDAPLTDFFRKTLALEAFFVRAENETGMRLRYTPPQSLGADRLCNAVAAAAKYGAPVIVIDFGTATKLEAVGANGDYLGGAILPGIGVSTDALLQRAAKLVSVDWNLPERAIGQSTAEAMRSGFVFGFAEQAEGLIRRFRAEMGGAVPAIATGGLASRIVHACPSIQAIDPYLTLDGVQRIYAQTRREA